MKVIGLMAIGLIVVIGIIFMQYGYAAIDYEASNRTGNMTSTTNQTVTDYTIQSTWWYVVAALILILVMWAAFKMFVK